MLVHLLVFVDVFIGLGVSGFVDVFGTAFIEVLVAGLLLWLWMC